MSTVTKGVGETAYVLNRQFTAYDQASKIAFSLFMKLTRSDTKVTNTYGLKGLRVPMLAYEH